MKLHRVRFMILAAFLALALTLPAAAPALAEGAEPTPAPVETPAPAESAAAQPAGTAAVKPNARQYKVKFVDQVTGKAIGPVQRVSAGSAATLPEAPDHADLGFQFAGWNRDVSSVKKNLTVVAQYATIHGIAAGDHEVGRAAAGGALSLQIPVVFRNGLTGDEIASNILSGGGATGYDEKRPIPEYDQSALQNQGIEWIRLELDLSGTPLKAAKDGRVAYVMRAVKDSRKKYGIQNGHPVNRGFAVFGAIKARADAAPGEYPIQGRIVWRLKGTQIDSEAPFETRVRITPAGQKDADAQGGTVSQGSPAPGETASPEATAEPEESGILVAPQAKGDQTPVVQIFGPEATPEPAATPEATESPEPSTAPEATESPEPSTAPEASPEPAATPEVAESPEPTAAPEITESTEPAATPEVTESAEPSATPETADAAEPGATPEPAAGPAADAALLIAKSAALALEPKGEGGEDEGEDEDTEGDDTAGQAAMYTVTFVDYDGKTIATTTVEAGYAPATPGDYVPNEKPIKKIDGTWSVFKNWHPALTAVTQNVSIAAHYEALPNPVEITYVDPFDGATFNNVADAETAVNSHTDLGYEFTGWDEAAALSNDVIHVEATAQYDWTGRIEVCPQSFATGKPKGAMTIALPISLKLGGDPAYSDTLAATQKRAAKYTGKETEADFSQALIAMGLAELYIRLDAFGSDSPVTAASLSDAYVVQGGVNRGYAVFDNIQVKSSATNGYYVLGGSLYWRMQGSTLTNKAAFTTQVRVTGASSSSGGSSYGGGGSTGTDTKPQAKLVVEAITTDPLSPKAGQSFDVVLSLKNTSPDQFVQNIDLTYTTDEDALMPAAGSNSVYIAKIDKNESYEQRLSVKASPDIAKEDVKIELAMEYEDKKLTALTASQTVMVKVAQVQRIQLDELQLPSTPPAAGDSAEIKFGIFNLGRTVLYNVTAKVISENANLVPGQAFYAGNMDPGTSKTAELEAIPLEGGQYAGTVELTYENAVGDVFTEKRPFTLTANSLDTYNYGADDYETDLTPVEPEAPSAAEIMRYLPPWIYASVGVLLLMIVLGIAMSARRRRKRMFEDDEMD